MWVKRTEEEIAQEQQRQRRSHLRLTALVGAFVAIILAYCFTSRERRGQHIVPADEIPSRIPMAVAFGFVVAFLYYKTEKRVEPMMICPQCETAKYMDNKNECTCGSRFEKMDDMKYVREDER
jgi:hypothetical protein